MSRRGRMRRGADNRQRKKGEKRGFEERKMSGGRRGEGFRRERRK